MTHDILTQPAPSVKVVAREYTPQQTAQIDELRTYATTLLLPESDPYYPREKKWLLEDTGCIPRYLRASKWKLEDAKKRIKGTLEWRRDYKPDLIPADEVKPEAETGKLLLNGFDRDGRPILYLRPGKENTKESPRQIRHLVFHIERAIDFMPPGVESMVCLVDYRSATLKTSPSVANARHFLTIVQNHYVERLGRAIVVHLPWVLNFFFKAISPFLDPVTRDKMRFNPDLLDLIPAEQLDATLAGGAHPYEFEHETYWRQVCVRAGVNGDGSRFDPLPAIEAAAAAAGKPVDAAEAVTENGNATANGNGKAVDGAGTEPEVAVAVIEPAPSGTDVTSSPGAATPASPPVAASETRAAEPAAAAAGTETSQEEEAGAGTQPRAGAEPAPQSQLDPDPASAPAGGASQAEPAEPVEAAPGAVDPERLRELRQQAIGKYEQTQANLERNREKEE